MMTKSEQINDLAAALAAAQSEMENASKSSSNPHFKSKYADLAEVINTVRPVFGKHGLSQVQCPSYEGGMVSVETIIMHKSGQWLSSTVSAPVSKQDAQGVGSAITYCRRYSLAAMAGLAQEDDDANSAVGHGKGTPAAKAEPRRPVTEAPPKTAPLTFIKPDDVEAELRGAFGMDDLASIFTSRWPMMQQHYNKTEIDRIKAVKDEMKAALSNAA